MTRDCILHPVFEDNYTYKLIENFADNDTVRFERATGSSYTENIILENPHIATSINSAHNMTFLFGAFPNDPEIYEFQYWLKDDGSDPPALTNTYHEERARWLRGENIVLDRDTTFIAWFAPVGQHIIRLNWPEVGGSVDRLSGQMAPRSVITDNQSFLYYFTNDPVTITATPDEGYEFIGWYDGNTLVSPEQQFPVSSATKNYNLTPVFEPTVENRDYFHVWFDGSNGVYGGNLDGHGTETFYARMDGSGHVTGSEHFYERAVGRVYDPSTGTYGSTTITLPTTAPVPRGQTETHYEVKGWYEVYTGQYYSLEEYSEVTLTGDAVFYADWFPDSYSYSQAANLANTVDTNISCFITTRVFDYNNLFNIPSITLVREGQTDSNNPKASNVSALGNYEYWRMNGMDSDFVFMSGVSGTGRTLNPVGRDGKNSSNEVDDDGDYYVGLVHPGLLELKRNALFSEEDGLGKRYVGRGNHLYQYDENSGYYYYDSDRNAASYNQDNQRFYVYNYTNKTDKSTKEGDWDFLPFNYSSGEKTFIESNTSTSEVNYWFGLSSDVNFYLPNAIGPHVDNGNEAVNQSTKGTDMVYKFAGDDDVWVLVDNELFLDLGGVHGKVYGEINFSTGKITIVQGGYKTKKDSNQVITYDTSQYLLDKTTHENKTKIDVIDFPIDLDEGEHTLTLYYLERGASQSNCAIYFNLAPRYTLQFKKIGENDSQRFGNVVFGIFTDPECTTAANLWGTYSGRTDNAFTTGQDGLVHVSGLTAGHTYYIKELVAPSNYPDVSAEVITLVIDADGTPHVSSSADSNTWTMAEVRSSEDNDQEKGTFLLYLTVKNKNTTDITAKKVWANLDGGDYTIDQGSYVKVKLQRYTITNNDTGTAAKHKVRIISQYFSEDGVPIPRDTGTIKTFKESEYEVNHGGSVSFSVSSYSDGAADPIAIYSVASGNGNVSIESTSNQTTGRPYRVNNGRVNLPRTGSYSLTNIERDTDIYVTFIGKASNEETLSHIATVSTPVIDGNAVYRKEDETFNNAAQEITLDSSNSWMKVWNSLVTTGADGTFYYYIKETAARGKVVNNQQLGLSNYITSYSSEGLSAGTIVVHNTFNALNVKLRKTDDSTPGNNLQGAEFKIYPQDAFNSETNTPSGSPIDVLSSGYLNLIEGSHMSHKDGDGTTLISDSEGRFYTGYLPAGIYYLVETEAPSGYIKRIDPIKIEISGKGLRYYENGEWHNKNKDSNGYYNFYITNSSGAVLPATGGPGNLIFYLIGVLLILSSGFWLLVSQKKRNAA